MKRIYIVLALSFLVTGILFGGTIKELKGSVEVMIDNKWQPAKEGMEVPDGVKIMTSVNSSAKISGKVGYFIVKEMSVVTYSEKDNGQKVDQSVSIDVGKVRVRYDKVEGIKSTFKVQTPKGTASVRGTEKDVSYFPNSGMKIVVIEGLVDVIDNQGNGFMASVGETAGVSSDGEIFGSDDLAEDTSGLNNAWSDDDTQNSAINDITDGFYDDSFPETPQFPTEPERL